MRVYVCACACACAQVATCLCVSVSPQFQILNQLTDFNKIQYEVASFEAIWTHFLRSYNQNNMADVRICEVGAPLDMNYWNYVWYIIIFGWKAWREETTRKT
jgi:hypothetical protein